MRLTIGLITLGLRFDGDSLKAGSLGGSETAFIYMARELAKLGHDVRVFCECPKQGIYDGVQYFHHSGFIPQSIAVNYDILIVSRWQHFLTAPTNVGLRVLWLHDMPTDQSQLMTCLWQTDLVLGLSKFHIDQYSSRTPELREHFWQTSNGVDLELVKRCTKPKIENKLIYTSRPERGLDVLLEKIFPRLLLSKPDLQLYYCAYDISGMQLPYDISAKIQKSSQLAQLLKGNVKNLGSLNKEQLYHHISSSKLWLFPTDFPEISCIGAMEAQACGTPIVSTYDFALKETVLNGCTGTLIEGDGVSEAYCDAFVTQTLALLDDKEQYQKNSENGPKSIAERGLDWSAVAKSWEKKFTEMMQLRFTTNTIPVLKQLERNHDLVPAKMIAESLGFEEEADLFGNKIQNLVSGAPKNTQEVKDRWKYSLNKFSMCAELMKACKIMPKRVLDYCANDVAFGIYIKQALPPAEVVVLAQDIATRDRIIGYADKNNLDIKVRDEGDVVLGDVKYDVIFIEDYIDQLEHPETFLNELKSHLTKDGWFVLVVRSGATSATLPEEHTRCWNFGHQDFVEMFADCKAFSSTFIDQGFSNGGDLKGNWCVCVQPTGEVKCPSIQRRMLITRPYVSLAVCMITKDEEDWIRGCVKTFKDIADKVVICDTGSTDKTLSILQDFETAEFAKFELRQVEFDNFGQVRNASIKDVKEDWILWMDADEKLVGAENLRKYLQSAIYNGYAISQRHLMLDVQGTADRPVRLFKNNRGYAFVGYIHEHCEDVTKGPYGHGIMPAMVIDDVDLAHYGYLNEQVRRAKCSNRNMELLRRDIVDNGEKGRELTWVLVIRDHLNIMKWDVEKHGFPIQPGSESHTRLNAVIDCYHKRFAANKDSKYKALAFPMYQEALQVMGVCQLIPEGCAKPPFEVGFALAGAVGPLQPESKKLGVSCHWFLNDEEYFQFIQEQSASLISKIDPSLAKKYEKYIKREEGATLPYSVQGRDDAKLLSKGVNVMPQARM